MKVTSALAAVAMSVPDSLDEISSTWTAVLVVVGAMGIGAGGALTFADVTTHEERLEGRIDAIVDRRALIGELLRQTADEQMMDLSEEITPAKRRAIQEGRR